MRTNTGSNFSFTEVDAQSARASTLESNPAFMRHYQTICMENPDIDPSRLWVVFVGSKHGVDPGPYDYADTPEKILAYYREENPKPFDKTEAAEQRNAERNAKSAAQAIFLHELDAYHIACRERKSRHERAKLEHRERVLESERILAKELSDPAPERPYKRQ